jgi:hypothetical protein
MRLARDGVRARHANEIDLTIPEELRLRGANLCTLTEAMTYAGIRERNEKRESNSNTEDSSQTSANGYT